MNKVKVVFTDIKKFRDLEYVTLRKVPTRQSKKGTYYDASYLQKADKILAKKILEDISIPIRGKEVDFLRKAAGLSYNKLGARLGMTDVGIIKWIKKKERLRKPNEAAFRLVMNEIFNIQKVGFMSEVVGSSSHPPALLIF